jgi:hypothetical protein
VRDPYGNCCAPLPVRESVTQDGVVQRCSEAAFDNWSAVRKIQAATRWRIAGQVTGGMVAAAAFGLGAWSLVDDPGGSDRRVKGDAGYTPNANTAYAAASFVGATAVVYLFGRGDGSDGSLLATALGSGVATALLFLGRHEPYLPLLGVALGAPLQAIGGTIGYQRTR